MTAAQRAKAVLAANLRRAVAAAGRSSRGGLGELAAATWPSSTPASREQRLRRALSGEVLTLDTAAELAAQLEVELGSLFSP